MASQTCPLISSRRRGESLRVMGSPYCTSTSGAEGFAVGSGGSGQGLEAYSVHTSGVPRPLWCFCAGELTLAGAALGT